MPIIKGNEPLSKRPCIVVFYAEGGLGKTTLANTCNNPIVLDFDRGIDRSKLRKDCLQVTSWDEVLELERRGELDGYDTIVIDTAKAALDDFLVLWAIDRDSRMANAKYKMQLFGAIGDEFKRFINARRAKKADIVVVAHAKKDEDTKKVMPDVTGQSYNLLARTADTIGYLTIRNKKRIIQFEPTDEAVGKNCADLKTIELPPYSSEEYKTFGAHILEQVKAALASKSEEQKAAEDIANNYYKQIAEAELSELDMVITPISELPQYLQVQLYHAIINRMGTETEAAETPEALTTILQIANELPEQIKKTVRGIIAGQAKKKEWVANKETGGFELKKEEANG